MRRILVSFAVLLTLAAASRAAEKKGKQVDLIWQRPDLASFAVPSIAMLPPSSFDHSLQAEKLADQHWGATLRGTGYRWLSGTSARALLLARPDGDSLLKALDRMILESDQARVDSLAAPDLCRRLRTRAVLTLRIDRWEQLEMEFNQAGKPSTTVSLKAALVDSTGALLWTASGSETLEGPYHDPNAGVVGIKSSGLGSTPMTGQGKAPSYPEVLNVLVTRFGQQFPAKPAAPAPASTP